MTRLLDEEGEPSDRAIEGSMDRSLAPNLRVWFPPPGFFIADARSKDYALVVAPGRGCSVQLVYSRFWGNFASAPKVTHHGA